MDSHYYGIQTARYCSIVITPDYILTPIGTYVTAWTHRTLERIQSWKLHSDLVTVLLETANGYVSMSYSGEVKIWTKDFEMLSEARSEKKILRHGAVNLKGDLVAAWSESGSYNGVINVWKIVDNQLISQYTVKGNYKFCEFTSENNLFAMRKSLLEKSEGLNAKRDQPIEESKILTNFSSEDDEDPQKSLDRSKAAGKTPSQHYATVHRREGESTYKLLDTYSAITCNSVNKNGIVAMSFSDRSMVVMEMESLEIMHSFKVQGVGGILSIYLDDKKLYFSPNTKNLTQVDIDQPQLTGELDLPTRNTGLQFVSKGAYGFRFFANQIVVCDLATLGWARFEQIPWAVVESKKIDSFDLTCCGWSIGPDVVAVGDFIGNIKLFPLDKSQGSSALRVTNIGTGIRSLLWKDYDLYVGTVSGQILILAGFGYEDSEPLPIDDVGETVVAMKIFGDFLVAGTVRGELHMYLDNQKLWFFTAHEPQEASDTFGSLANFSEIWSLDFSSDGQRLGTGSEDQTVVVWRFADGLQSMPEKEITLPKHALAVTGVLWRDLEATVSGVQVSRLLLTCSDDKTLRVYNAQDYNLLHTFSTLYIRQWHTLTYVASQGERAIVVSQNGYLFVFNLVTQEWEFGEKIHIGSVEGLDWKEDYAATCSSDCTVAVFKM